MVAMYSIVVFDGRNCQILRGAFKLIFGFGTSLVGNFDIKESL